MNAYLDGQYMDDIAIGAELPPVELSFPLNIDVFSHPQSETDHDSEEMDSTSYGEEDDVQDTSSYSLLSNSGQLPIIDEVNEFITDRAQHRLHQSLDQLKRETEESSSATYDPSVNESMESTVSPEETSTVTNI